MEIFKNQQTNKENKTISTVICETEFRDLDVTFCHEDFLEKIKFNPEHWDTDCYLIEYLNEHEIWPLTIEGEDYGYLQEPMPQHLQLEAERRIKKDKFENWRAK